MADQYDASSGDADLSARQEHILSTLVRLYVQDGEPVSSKQLSETGLFDCSSATIRNELATLEHAGFVMQPHTSAGRVPTDKGYRQFVNEHARTDLEAHEQQTLQEEFLKLRAQYERAARLAAKLLAQHTGSVGFSAVPQRDVSYGSGMAQLLSRPSAQRVDELAEAALLLEQLDERSGELLHEPSDQVHVFIGNEHPVFRMQHTSLLLTQVTFPNGEKGLVALIGPKRMPYERNVSVVHAIRQLLSGPDDSV